MNHRWLRRILILLAAVVLCVVMARSSYGGRHESTGSLTLWYTESDCPPAVMEALAARCREEEGLLIETRAFESETALGFAFDSDRPDLVFCSQFRAAGFSKRESLDGDALSFPETLRTAWEEIGRSFFPVGGRLPLLVVNTALTSEKYESLEALLAAAGEEPFLASNDWSELLNTAMTAKGRLMWGDPSADGKNESYRSLYNPLAEAAFRGALVPAEDALEYVRQGKVPCAVVRSTELTGLTDKNLDIRPLPLPEGAQLRYPAELMGFAMPEGADTEAAGSFLRWLFGGNAAAETALAAGLVPVMGTANAATSAETCLLELSKGGSVCWPTPDTVFYQRREECERRLSRTLALLE